MKQLKLKSLSYKPANLHKKLLVIGHNFPEPTTTAAGSRMLQLLGTFKEESYQITFATTAQVSEHTANLDKMGIDTMAIRLNDASFDVFIAELNPTIVLFDRFVTEEQFGWRVTEQCPQALRILDTEDLHFLRKAREASFKKGEHVVQADIYTDTAKRELASMYRCDLSLIISEVEMQLLQTEFNIPKQLLHYVPFMVAVPSEAEKKEWPSFENRQHFMTIGNFKHAPNIDAVHYLKTAIWPLIKKEIPTAQIHIYGAYAPQQITQLHNESEGFLIKGWATAVGEVMQTARVCLAPLRFGAGLKGKLLDAMYYGTPAVTTSMGAEGMHGSFDFAGAIADDATSFAAASVQLHNDHELWLQAQKNGFKIIEARFKRAFFSKAFQQKINTILEHIEAHRQGNFVGQLLQHHSMQSTKYLSKWIEAKGAD